MKKLVVSSSPHLHTHVSLEKIMWSVVASLAPAGLMGILFFGLRALWVIIIGVTAALASEAALELFAKRKVTILDGSAVLTGLLLAYNLPPNVPWWIPVAGSFFSIAIGKLAFGGLGQNIFNPALVGRVFLMASWPRYMTTFAKPIKNIGEWMNLFKYDAITAATPLALLKEEKSLGGVTYLNLFFGNHGGCIGEVCVAALLLGALFLFFKKYISWHIPLAYIATVGLLTFVFGPRGLLSGNWILHILSGGLILGAFFMATDYVTSPLTRKGQLIFGIGCGVITSVIRLWGGYPEGVSYAILMMNAATPIIDRYTKTRIFGK